MNKLFYIFIFLHTLAKSQLNLDSLKKAVNEMKDDTARAGAYLKIAELESDDKVWPQYNEMAFMLATKLLESDEVRVKRRAQDILASATNNKGFASLINNRFGEAYGFFAQAIELKKNSADRTGLGTFYSNMGALMDRLGRLEQALEYYQLALKAGEEEGRTSVKAVILNNIGNIYNSSHQYDKAIECFKESVELHKKNNNLEQLSQAYTNMGAVYKAKKDFARALEFCQRGLDYALKAGSNERKASAYSKLADTYSDMKNYDSSLVYSERCLQLSKNEGYTTYLASELVNIGFCLYCKGDFKGALPFLQRGYIVYDSISDLYGRKYSSSLLFSNYDSLGDFKAAYHYLKIHDDIKDSLFHDDSRNAIIKQGLQMDFDKKESELKLAKAEKEKEVEQQKLLKNGFIIGSAMLLALVLLVVVNLVNTRKAKRKIEEQKALVEEQKKTVEEQKNEVEQQKLLVEEKQQEIISSINYARRIQSAVLTSDEVWKKISKEHFILFKPKDIVSGDFYWAHVLPTGRAVFALADCTGHGVPGGFMSMLGNSFLNEIVVENKIFNAAAILNKLREKIIQALEQQGGGSEQKDGMDMALCVWNKMDNTLEFAGANNGLYVVRDGKIAWLEGNKMPIGKFLGGQEAFTSQTVQLQKADLIYLCTDGFADQFGGAEGKKYKYKQFEKLLLSLCHLPLDEQMRKIEEEFTGWKANFEQTDDVSVVGIRV